MRCVAVHILNDVGWQTYKHNKSFYRINNKFGYGIQFCHSSCAIQIEEKKEIIPILNGISRTKFFGQFQEKRS